MTDSRPPAARIAPPSAGLAYATIPSRSHTWRLAAAVAALAVGCGGILAQVLAVWGSREWMAANVPSQIAIAMTNYSIEFLGQLAVALFGLALLRRSPRAWHAAVAYFTVQMINPLLA